MPVVSRAVLEGSFYKYTDSITVETLAFDSEVGLTKVKDIENEKDIMQIVQPKRKFPCSVDTSALYEAIDGLHRKIESTPSLKEDYTSLCKHFYMIQSIHSLGENCERLRVPVYFDEENRVPVFWRVHFRMAVRQINSAAPGLNIVFTDNESEARILITTNDKSKCYTVGNIFLPFQSEISVSKHSWDNYLATSIHELLHALGFAHEMKRLYASIHVLLSDEIDDEERFQYEEDAEHLGITRFDPFSIMMYPESAEMKRKYPGDPVWRLKTNLSRSEEMSELDKVGLNLIFKPCKSEHYSPTISTTTGMVYCGRSVTSTHNNPAPRMTDGRCGPNNGPNCPACRVLIRSDFSPKWDLNADEKWQGWSGYFYCGKPNSRKGSDRLKEPYTRYVYEVVHDGICGPNNGVPCDECGKLTNPNYDVNAPFKMWEEFPSPPKRESVSEKSPPMKTLSGKIKMMRPRRKRRATKDVGEIQKDFVSVSFPEKEIAIASFKTKTNVSETCIIL